MRQPQVEAQLGQLRVAVGELAGARPAAQGVGLDQPFLEIEGGVLEPAGDDEALAAGELLGLRQQPGQKVVDAGEDHHLVLHGMLSSG